MSKRPSVIKSLAISPTAATCGESIVLKLALRIGGRGIPRGGFLTIDCPGYLGSTRPQFLYQEQDGFVSVDLSAPDLPWRGSIATTDRARKLLTREDYLPLAEKAYRPFRLICLQFSAGVKPGVALTVALGAGGGGFGTGYRVGVVSPRPEFAYRFLLKLYAQADDAAPLEEHAAPLIVRAQTPCLARVVRHASGKTHLSFWDRFGNPSPVRSVSALIEVKAERLKRNNHGVFETRTHPVALATKREKGSDPFFLIRDSAPMNEVAQGYSIYWGDLHTHSAFSCDVKTNERSEMRPEDHLRFARDAAALDFVAMTDHHFVNSPKKALSAAEWDETVRAVTALTRDGEFIPIPGYEHRCLRGDTVVLFTESPTFAEITDPAHAPVETLWDGLRNRGVLTIPHYHDPGRLPPGEWIGPRDLRDEPVQEVFSCHGRFDVPVRDGLPLGPPLVKLLRADRNAAFLLQRGRRYGTICASDDHKGRPGTNGLAAVFAKELTRPAIFEALRARRCYGTTNARIRLVFTINDVLMGGEIAGARQLRFALDVRGTTGLRYVDLLKNGRLLRRFKPRDDALAESWRMSAGDQPAYYQVMVAQEDQEMAWSSPIWIR